MCGGGFRSLMQRTVVFLTVLLLTLLYLHVLLYRSRRYRSHGRQRQAQPALWTPAPLHHRSSPKTLLPRAACLTVRRAPRSLRKLLRRLLLHLRSLLRAVWSQRPQRSRLLSLRQRVTEGFLAPVPQHWGAPRKLRLKRVQMARKLLLRALLLAVKGASRAGPRRQVPLQLQVALQRLGKGLQERGKDHQQLLDGVRNRRGRAGASGLGLLLVVV
mmetsp:Transcript_63029/g.168925  ORF Transcript_63029/g.168925 Transcript_63029/m.168925 type:complete len:215 (-) Transcript_63029:260-904(-)